jgi:hypothetical protein
MTTSGEQHCVRCGTVVGSVSGDPRFVAAMLSMPVACPECSPFVHLDSGFRCLVAHGDGDGGCIHCTCGEFVRPKLWKAHQDQHTAPTNSDSDSSK